MYFLLSFVLISGCVPSVNSSENTSISEHTIVASEEPVSLFNTWKVTSISNPSRMFQGPANTTRGHGSRPFRITFLKETVVTLSLSVNDCSAGYSLKNSIISFQPKITCTEACCDSNQDEFLICQFSGPLKYSIKGKLLTIDAEAGPIEFTLSAK
jgi:hypothetical protein